MANSDVEIWNLALMRVGVSKLVQAPDEDSTEAAICRAASPLARDAVLSAVPWPFAARRAELSSLVDGERTGWSYAYALPADCLQVRDIVGPVRNPRVDQRISYVLEHDPTAGKILLTDHAPVEVVYTARIEQPNLYPPGFIEALAWRLAMDAGLALEAKEGLLLRARQNYEVEVARAAAAALGEQRREQPPESEFITGRW